RKGRPVKVATAVRAADLPRTASDRGRGRHGRTRRLTGDAVQPDFAAVAAATDCTGWTVRGVVAHVAGACEAAAHFRVLWRHNRIADSRCRHRQWIGAQAGCQLHDRTGRGRRDLVAELAVAGPAGMRFHRRMPALLRRCTVPDEGTLPAGAALGYLSDVICAKGLWMHRADL